MEKTIQQILTPNYLKRFKKSKNNHPQTLFGMDWKQLKDRRCPVCACKLVEMRKSPKYICRSKKHLKPFLIDKEKLINR